MNRENTTAAIGKGFAIGAAALAALAIIAAFVSTVSANRGEELQLLLDNPMVLIGVVYWRSHSFSDSFNNNDGGG